MVVVSSESAEILGNGSVISFGYDPLIFKIQGSTNSIIVVTVKFMDDNKRTESYIDGGSTGQLTSEVRFYNFNNDLGSGNTEPIDLATLDDKKLLLNFWVASMGTSRNHMIHYTWYLKEIVK